MFDTRPGAAVRKKVKCPLENLNVQSESVFRSKGKTTMPLWGEGEQEFEPPAC